MTYNPFCMMGYHPSTPRNDQNISPFVCTPLMITSLLTFVNVLPLYAPPFFLVLCNKVVPGLLSVTFTEFSLTLGTRRSLSHLSTSPHIYSLSFLITLFLAFLITNHTNLFLLSYPSLPSSPPPLLPHLLPQSDSVTPPSPPWYIANYFL